MSKTTPGYRRALFTCPFCLAEQAQNAAEWVKACTSTQPVICTACGADIDAASTTYVKDGGNYFGEAALVTG